MAHRKNEAEMSGEDPLREGQSHRRRGRERQTEKER